MNSPEPLDVRKDLLTLPKDFPNPPKDKLSFIPWLRTLSDHNIPYDTALEKLVLGAESRINELKQTGEGLTIQRAILVEESQLMAQLAVCAGATNHEGRVIQVLELQTRHVGTALEYLRLYHKENPGAPLSELSNVTETLSFDQRELVNQLSLVDELERFVSRSTLRETVLGYAENIIDSLNHYPIQIVGLYRFPKIPELLIDSALESVRLFFELDSAFLDKYQEKRIAQVSIGIANAMHSQLKVFFARTCSAFEYVQDYPQGIDIPYTQTYLASERLLRFTRRIIGGINSMSGILDAENIQVLTNHCNDAQDIRAR